LLFNLEKLVKKGSRQFTSAGSENAAFASLKTIITRAASHDRQEIIWVEDFSRVEANGKRRAY
jgi:hypothetical protein